MLLFLPKISGFAGRCKRPAFWLIFFAFFIAGKAAGQTPVSGTFTIDASQPSTGTNFQTFTEAIFSLAYGVNGPVVFNVAPGSGPYAEQININFVPGVSPVNTITFNGNGATIENTSNNAQARAVIKLDHASYITINNLKINAIVSNAADSYGWGVGIIHDADFNTIKNCTITIVGAGNLLLPQSVIGIYVGSTDDFPDTNGISDCDNNTIDNNTITGGYDGIDLNNYAGNSSFEFTSMNNNKVTNNHISGFRSSGIHMIWNKNTLVQGNDISGTTIESADGIHADEKNTGLQINGNKIHNISGTSTGSFNGIEITNCPADADARITISNNVIYDLRTPQAQTGIDLSSCSYINVYHNTIVLDGPAVTSGIVAAGFKYEGTNSNINFKNNILSLSRQGGTGYGIYVTAAGTAFVSDYNDVVLTAPNNFGRNVSTTYAALAAWQTGTSRDAHSASQDPLFTDLAGGNLKPTSPAIDNMGTFAGITSDIVGDIRNNNTPDAGAYEFLTPPCNTPVVPGASVGIPTTPSCGGGLRTLNLSGNSFGTGQTYQWQSSSTLAGTYTNVGGSLIVPVLDVYPTVDIYYRAIVGCGASSAISDPILITVKQPLSGTYTINFNAATAGTNFKTFADALAAFSCGVAGPVVLNVVAGSGPYNEHITFNPIINASAVNTITINGNGETLTWLSTVSADRSTLKLNGANYFIIDNLTITAQGAATGQYGFGLHLMHGASHNIIRNCRVNSNLTSTSSNFAGVVVNDSDTDPIGGGDSKCSYNKITGNTITGGYYGIVLLSDPSIAKIVNDTLSNNIVKDQHVYGILVRGTDHALIEGNDISRPVRAVTGAFIGIYLNAESSSLLVSKNKIHNTHGGLTAGTDAPTAISSNNCDATAGAENIFSNNVIYDFGLLGAQVGINNTGSDYALYYHNSISLEKQTGTPTTTARAFFQSTAATGIEFKDNVVVIKRSGTGANHGIYMNTPATTFTASNNNYFIAGTGNNKTGFRNATSYATIDDWRTANATDAGSLGVDPVWAGLAAGNLTPTAAAMDNKGIFVGVAKDINGVTRSTTVPDIGAYEYTFVLPVKLLSISAAKVSKDVLVKWTTVTEVNTDRFVVERSSDAVSFRDAGTVSAAGNSSTYQHYQFNDLNAAAAAVKVLYYRLRIVDLDGHTEYSNVVPVHIGTNESISIAVQPNPFATKLTGSIVTDTPGKATIRISDAAGRTISTQSQAVSAGTTLINIDNVDRLQKGVYIVSIELNGNNFVQKIIK